MDSLNKLGNEECAELRAMSSEHESTKRDDEDLSSGLLLRDIEEISKALYLHRGPQQPLISSYYPCPNAAAKTGGSKPKSSVIVQDSLNTDKKSSLWNWKPLRALAHIRNHRFNCCFFLHVHAIEGLPPEFNDHNLCVTWKRKNEMLRSRPVRACLGVAEFEETLMHRCTIYGSRTGPHSSAKYEPKIFLLHVSVVGPSEVDIGNHWIDLSRLLPIKLEELEGDKGSSGKWTTSFKLTGEAKGAMLNVSFGFSILDGKSIEPDGLKHFADFDNLGNAPRVSTEGSYSHSQSTNVNCLEEIFPKQDLELSHSVTLLYRKLDEKIMGNAMDLDHSPEPAGGKTECFECSDTDFDVAEQGIEVSMKDQIKIEICGCEKFESTAIETIDVAEIFDGEETAFDEYVKANLKFTRNHEEHKYAADDNEHRDNSTCVIEPSFEEYGTAFYDMLTSYPAEDSLLDINNYYEQECYEKSRSMKSLSLDDVSESIENDFLNMLSIDQSQYDDDNGTIIDSDDCDLSFATQAVEKNHNTVHQSFRSRRNAKALENLESKALMHEWGLTEKAFQYSPHANSGGFGSPVYIPAGEPLKLPSIEEGMGPIIRTKDGGFLRSMSPLLFTSANNGARLIVQVSGPVVLPPAMGFTVMEILQCWASGGVEKMCIQLNELMPLEDVTGKTMREVFSEVESELNAFDRGTLQQESDVGLESFVSENVSCSNSEQMDSDYVSLEDLVPMTITNIEGLLVQGLKIQSGMPDQEPALSIRLNAPEHSCFVGVDELMKYPLSLKEWIRLDSGEFCVQDETDENTLKRFAAHCAEPIDNGTVEMPGQRNCGVFGKNFKMGLKVQLRDPLRNYEMVGSSMLALVQVHQIYSAQQDKNKICGPLFKVSEVHVAGLNVTHGNKQHPWGTSRQQQSGFRWLLSSGMAKSNKCLIPNSSAVIKSSNGLMRKGDVLWSISLPNQGQGATWDERVALNVHVRNPDIIFL